MAWLHGRSDPYETSADHLRDELHRAAGLVRAQLLRFRQACPELQRERFWHLPDDYVEAVAQDESLSPLAAFDASADVKGLVRWLAERRKEIDRRVEATKTGDLRLARLRREFGLSDTDVDALLLALLPIIHSIYRRWYGVLQQDAAKPLATAGLLVEMLASSARDYGELGVTLGPSGHLAASRLIVLAGSDDEPLAMRAVTIEDRVTGFLFGADRIDARVERVARWFDDKVELRTLPVSPEIANRLEMLPNLRAAEPDYLPRLRVEFLGPDPGLAVRAFATVAAGLGRRLLVVDGAAAVAGGPAWPVVVDCVLREVRLAGGSPIFTGLGAQQETVDTNARFDYLTHRLAAFPHPAAIEVGSPSGEETRASAGWIPFRLVAPTITMREQLWTSLLASRTSRVAERAAVARDLANAFQLTDTQIREAWRAAESLARRRNVFIASIEPDDLFAACRQQSSRRLVAFAQRIEPRNNLDLDRDVVLPPANKRALLELHARIKHHARVHSAMGIGAHMRLGRGVTALFVGPSGTGKTLAAEVLASEHQVDLYRVDLASVLSKWLGEMEQNLSRVLADAERANCMLFFDEADAIFGRRGDVREARDRWANVEVNFLLQRIEDHSGVVILATNMRQNIDEAFQRRINVFVEFPTPDVTSRLAIWQRLLPADERSAVAAADLQEVAERFDVSGGDIRNIVLDAFYRALDEGEGPVTTRHVIASAAREYQKASRPVTRGDFGRFYEWAIKDVVAPERAATTSRA